MYASDESRGKYSDTTLLIKVGGQRSLKCAIALIADMMERNTAQEIPTQEKYAGDESTDGDALN